ncbi:hypothetical protein J0895_17405 [Phormidium pseudopriestleyi FRX01]|uniref:Uncharacterized protein n=1 Tax=Phormidium pseudopriestleyi FRX01 TaxID=1759528 RepID=A0ABS3FUK5_9CYAN|nr:hypothetical protein [Phormidium pseudopriestleyi]MBO0350809.1 hypothetical protein [Phormidium pseudopriestleyi FRX01]
MSISLINVAHYYKQLPHQNQALTILQEKIESTHPEWLSDDSAFTRTWRNQTDNPRFSPEVEIISDRKQLRGEWGGNTYTIDVDELNVLVLDSYDIETGNQVDRELTGDLFAEVTVNPLTGHIVVGVVLDYFAATTTSGIFIIDPQPGGYAIYRAQVPGPRPFPNEFSTYGLRLISSLRFVEENLLVEYGDAASNISIMTFQPGNTPAMEYVNCVDVVVREGPGLCSRVTQ